MHFRIKFLLFNDFPSYIANIVVTDTERYVEFDVACGPSFKRAFFLP